MSPWYPTIHACVFGGVPGPYSAVPVFAITGAPGALASASPVPAVTTSRINECSWVMTLAGKCGPGVGAGDVGAGAAADAAADVDAELPEEQSAGLPVSTSWGGM